jgi:hypothetical protein
VCNHFISVGSWWLEIGGWKLVTGVGGRRLVAGWSVYHLCVVSLPKVYFLSSSLIVVLVVCTMANQKIFVMGV